MPNTGQRPNRRVLVHVPVQQGAFLDLICKLSGTRKRAMIDRIWEAGINEVFGRSAEEIGECQLTVPRQATDLSRDLAELTSLLCLPPQ